MNDIATHSDITIGITGGIGSGKSIVSRVLRCNGVYVYDCDFEAKEIMKKNSDVKLMLAHKLGEEIYQKNGDLDRPKLASLIFNNQTIRNFVNKVVHEAVKRDIKEKRKYINGRFFIESAILASSEIACFCKEIWVVRAPLEKRIERVILRDNLDINSILKRVKSQESELSLLDKEKTIEIINDNIHPVLIEVLNKINKLQNYKEYKISC